MLIDEIVFQHQLPTMLCSSPFCADRNDISQLPTISLISQRDIKQELRRHNKVSRLTLGTTLVTLEGPAINPQLSQLSIRDRNLVQPADQRQWTAGTSLGKQLLHNVVLQLWHDQSVGEDPDETETGGEELGVIGAAEPTGVHPVLHVAKDLGPLEVVDEHDSALTLAERAVETSCQHGGVVRRKFLEEGVSTHVGVLADGERDGGEVVSETRRRNLSNGNRWGWSI